MKKVIGTLFVGDARNVKELEIRSNGTAQTCESNKCAKEGRLLVSPSWNVWFVLVNSIQ